MEGTHLSLSSDDTYDADMIDRRTFVGESYDNDIFNRYFRKKDLKKLYKLFLKQVIPFTKKIMDTAHHPDDERLYNELNGHFFVIIDPFIQDIIDGDCKFFVGSNDNIPERYCIRGRIRQTLSWYLTWSRENNDNWSIDRNLIESNTTDSATINDTNNILFSSIAIQTESIVNTVATQTESIVNTVATQTEFIVNTVATQTEVIILQSDEIQVNQTNKTNSKVQLLNLFNQITQILTYNQKYNSKLLEIQQTFLNYIIQTDYNELLLAFSLIQTMRYKKDQNIGKIFSKYLQQKAVDYIENSFYQTEHDVNKYRIKVNEVEAAVRVGNKELRALRKGNLL
ncbi:1283_t:CDS:2, partial [Racocetra fulgida]